MIDLNTIIEHADSWDLMEFKKMISKEIIKNRNILKDVWYAGIQNIFLVVKF